MTKPTGERLKSLQEQVNCMELALAAILKEIKGLKGFDLTQVSFNVHILDEIHRLDTRVKPTNRDALEMRKAASMLYARAKQLEGE